MTLFDFQRYRPIIGSGVSRDGRWAFGVVSTPTSNQEFDPSQLYIRRVDLPLEESTWERVAPEATHSYGASIAPDSRQLLYFDGVNTNLKICVADLDSLDAAVTEISKAPTDPVAGKWICSPPSPSCLGTDDDGLRRVWRWDDLGDPPTAISPADWSVLDFCSFGDEGKIAITAVPLAETPSPKTRPQLLVLEADLVEFTAYELPVHIFGYLCSNLQGTRLGFLGRSPDLQLSPTHLWVVNLADLVPGEPLAAHCVTGNSFGWVSGYDWCPEGDSVIAALREGTHGILRYYHINGEEMDWSPNDAYLSGPSIDRSHGRAIYLSQNGDEPQHLMVSDINQTEPQRFSAFSAEVKDEHRIPCTTLRWEGPEGRELEGIWYALPESDQKPVIIWLHGGPAEHMSHTYSPYFQIFLEAGFQVFAPNYTGSTGRDTAFLRGNIHRLGEIDVADVRSSIELLNEKKLGDPEKRSLFGWSYGGTLALLTAAQTEGLCAVVTGAPVIDWVTVFGSTWFPAVSQSYFPNDIWEDRGPYDEASPVSHLSTMDTPTLIFQGEEDPRIPRSQCLLLYRLLQGKGVPTDLRFFPGEGHVFSHPLAVNDMLSRSLSWLKLHCDIDEPSP